MTKHFADRINVSTSGKLQGCIRMPKAVVGDVLRNASFRHPFLYRTVNP